MFLYETDRPRTWRPDLVATILAWIDTVPAAEWAYFWAFAVDEVGGLVAHFNVPPRRGGPPRRVTIRFDHNHSSISNDMWIWPNAKILPFDPQHLHDVADTF